MLFSYRGLPSCSFPPRRPPWTGRGAQARLFRAPCPVPRPQGSLIGKHRRCWQRTVPCLCPCGAGAEHGGRTRKEEEHRRAACLSGAPGPGRVGAGVRASEGGRDGKGRGGKGRKGKPVIDSCRELLSGHPSLPKFSFTRNFAVTMKTVFTKHHPPSPSLWGSRVEKTQVAEVRRGVGDRERPAGIQPGPATRREAQSCSGAPAWHLDGAPGSRPCCRRGRAASLRRDRSGGESSILVPFIRCVSYRSSCSYNLPAGKLTFLCAHQTRGSARGGPPLRNPSPAGTRTIPAARSAPRRVPAAGPAPRALRREGLGPSNLQTPTFLPIPVRSKPAHYRRWGCREPLADWPPPAHL